MVDIEFRIGGKKIHPNNIKDAFEKSILEQVKKNILSKLHGIKDPETGDFPKIVVKGNTLNNLSFEVNGSEALKAEIKKCLK